MSSVKGEEFQRWDVGVDTRPLLPAVWLRRLGTVWTGLLRGCCLLAFLFSVQFFDFGGEQCGLVLGLFLLGPLHDRSGNVLQVISEHIARAATRPTASPRQTGRNVKRLTNKINALFRRLKRFGYTTCNITVSDLIDTSGRDLFRKLCSSEHSLHHLLPPERKYSNLRNRGHRYELPEYCTNLHKKSYYSIIVFVHLVCFLFLIFVSCLLTVTLNTVHVRLTYLINITYLLTYIVEGITPPTAQIPQK